MSRRAAVLSVLACAAAAGVGSDAYRRHHTYKHFAVHEPGRVYRSAWLAPGTAAELVEKHGVRCVVNLCSAGEAPPGRWAAEDAAVTAAGAKVLRLPMPLTVDPADPALAGHLAALADPGNFPLLVHCGHGVTRTAKFLTLYDVAFRGRTAEASLAAQPTFGRDRPNPAVAAFAAEFQRTHKVLYPRLAAARPPAAPGTGAGVEAGARTAAAPGPARH